MNRYFDNASTSFPKPAAVAQAMSEWLASCGGTYGRAATPRVLDSVARVERCRNALSRLIGAKSEQSENLIFTHNATHASNLVLQGLDWADAKHVLISPMEHNAVMRPLEYLRQTRGVSFQALPAASDGMIDTQALEKIDSRGVRLLIINHMSNVNGVCQPLGAIGRWAKERKIEMMVDASQSIGTEEINIEEQMIDYLIFTGHKALFGPMGTGGVWLREPQNVRPLIYGGTGSNSASYLMPPDLPDRMEGGTPNVVGLVGLLAAIENHPVARHTALDLQTTIDRIAAIDGVKLYGHGSLFSIASSHIAPSALARQLYDHYRIEVRAGLHCAPAAHRHLGSFPVGTVRVATSPYHSAEDLAYLAQALERICI
ncbi:MAG: aminotransferase class V-fold PLP-dependent enzyme [Mucinivorans sp.]